MNKEKNMVLYKGLYLSKESNNSSKDYARLRKSLILRDKKKLLFPYTLFDKID
jgi:hypothetical protein